MNIRMMQCMSLLLAASTLAAGEPNIAKSFGDQVREYILEHPEVLLESLNQYQQKQKAEAQKKAAEVLITRRQDLSQGSPASKEKGSVTIVEFFDYQCGYCKKVRATLDKVVAANPNVRVVYKDFPILGPGSMEAAKAALAAAKQDGYFKFHEALMDTTAAVTPEKIKEIAVALGLDAAKLQADMESPEVLAAVNRNLELGNAINVTATPSFIVGGELTAGALDEAAFEALIKKAAW